MHSDLYSDDLDFMTNNLRDSGKGSLVLLEAVSRGHSAQDNKALEKAKADRTEFSTCLAAGKADLQ